MTIEEFREYVLVVSGSGAVAWMGGLALWRRYIGMARDLREERIQNRQERTEGAAGETWATYVKRQDAEIERQDKEIVRLGEVVARLSGALYDAQRETIKCEARMAELTGRVADLERSLHKRSINE